jgi:predicted HicB family RNase H-like nuclease
MMATTHTHHGRVRTGTETRQRTKMVGLRFRPEDHKRLIKLAEARGVSVASLFESTVADLLSTPLPDEVLSA